MAQGSETIDTEAINILYEGGFTSPYSSIVDTERMKEDYKQRNLETKKKT